MDRYFVPMKFKFFLVIYPGPKNPFLGIKIFQNFFELHLVPYLVLLSKKNSGSIRYQIRGFPVIKIQDFNFTHTGINNQLKKLNFLET
jgi:hypothetical protein